MQLLREDAVDIPIWQQLIDQGLPTEVYVPCGMQRDELLHTLVRVLDPWLTFLHRNYGLSRRRATRISCSARRASGGNDNSRVRGVVVPCGLVAMQQWHDAPQMSHANTASWIHHF